MIVSQRKVQVSVTNTEGKKNELLDTKVILDTRLQIVLNCWWRLSNKLYLHSRDQ